MGKTNMIYLIEFGFTDADVSIMLDVCPEISSLNKKDICNKINILKDLGCSDKHIINIFSTNPLGLCIDINPIINRLKELKFTCLNILLDSNPYILSIDVTVFNNYLKERVNHGEDISKIIRDLDDNPSLFLEI